MSIEWLIMMRGRRSYGAADDLGKAASKIRRCRRHQNDERHWHGATQAHFMTRLSLTEGDTESGDHVTARSAGAIE